MNEQQLRAVIAQVLHPIAPEADLATISPSDNLREALDIDSFDFLNLLVGINEKLGVDIPESDYGKLRSLDDLIRYLSARVA